MTEALTDGPGTALAWAKEMSAAGLKNTELVGVGSATLAVISGDGVITSCTGRLWSISNRMSRLVMMPTSLPPASVTGTPEMRYFPHSAST